MRKVDFLALVRRMQVLSIGPQTARSLEGMGVRVDFMPEIYSSEGILASLPRQWGAGKRIVVIRSDRGERQLIGGLQEEGANVSEVIVYRLVQAQDDPELKALVAKGLAGEIDAYAFTSPLSARTFLEAAEGLTSKQAVLDMLGRSIVAAIGKPTKEALEAGDVRVDVVPESATFEHLLVALKDAIDKRRGTR
jgi:uroporphyrinogen-III synthase